MSKNYSLFGILLMTVLLLVSGCSPKKAVLTTDNEKDLADMITYLEDHGYESSVEEAASDIFSWHLHACENRIRSAELLFL